jgi:hypothetical protein
MTINIYAKDNMSKYTISAGMAKLSGEATITNIDDSTDTSYDIDGDMTYIRIGTIKDKTRHQLRFGLEYAEFSYQSYEVSSIGGYAQFVKKIENKIILPYVSANFGFANQENWDNGFMIAVTPGILFKVSQNIEVDLGYGFKKLVLMKEDEYSSNSYIKEEVLAGINLGVNIKF